MLVLLSRSRPCILSGPLRPDHPLFAYVSDSCAPDVVSSCSWGRNENLLFGTVRRTRTCGCFLLADEISLPPRRSIRLQTCSEGFSVDWNPPSFVFVLGVPGCRTSADGRVTEQGGWKEKKSRWLFPKEEPLPLGCQFSFPLVH